MAGWQEKLELLGCSCNHSILLIFAGDNGISTELTGSYRPMQSACIVQEHLQGHSPTTMLLKQMGSAEIIIDVGLASQVEDIRVIDYNIKRGSRNFLHEDALEPGEVLSALQLGARLWDEVIGTHYDIILMGEIGISDTLCAAAIASVLTGINPACLTGKGSGNSKVIDKKIDIISRAMALRRPDAGNVADILGRFGGLEIAALTGFMTRARERKTPLILDGYVTSVAALLASVVEPGVVEYLLAPSLSNQTGHELILDRLGIPFLFDMDINYGEGLAAAIGLYLAQLMVKAFPLRV